MTRIARRVLLGMAALLCAGGLLAAALHFAHTGTNETVAFHGSVYRTASLSAETLEWLEWYNGLSAAEQRAISYVPAELRIAQTDGADALATES